MQRQKTGQPLSPPSHKRIIAMVAGMCMYYGVGYGIILCCYGLFLKPIATSLGASYVQVSFGSTLRLLFGTLTLVFAKYVIPRVNLKWFISANTLLLAAGAALTASAQNILAIHISSSILGIGCGFGVYIIIPTVFNQWFAVPAPYIGIATGGGMVFSVLGSVFLSLAIESFGWRIAYWIVFTLILVIMLPVSLFLIRYKPEEIGASIYPKGIGSKKSSAVQTGLEEEELNVGAKQARKTGLFWLILSGFLITSVVASMYSQLPTVLSNLGYGGMIVGTYTAIYLIGNSFFSFVLGYCCGRWNSARTYGIAALVAASGACILLFRLDRNLIILAIACFLMGGGHALGTVCGPAVVRDSFGRESSGAIFADMNVLYFICAALMTTLNGQIYTSTGSFVGLFILIIAAALVIFAIFSLVRILQRKLRARTQAAGEFAVNKNGMEEWQHGNS